MLNLGLGLNQSHNLQVAPPPLDSTENIELALSTRRLLSSYIGPLLRLRRDSDDAEQDFGYVGNNSLDTEAITTWLGAANGYVVTIYDQSGNGRNFANATAANQVVYDTSAMQQPCLGFNGTDQWLDDATSFTVAAGDFTFFSVLNYASVAAESAIYSSRLSADKLELLTPQNITSRRGFETGTDGDVYFSADLTPFTGDQVLTHKLVAPSSAALRINSTEMDTGATYTQQPLTSAQRIGRKVGSGAYFNGALAEFIIIKGAPTDAKLQALEVSATKHFYDISRCIEDDINGGYVVDDTGAFVTN